MGGYVLKEASGDPQVVLVGTGSELQVAVKAAEALEADGIAARVVSVPCFELFAEQPESYRREVLGKAPVRVGVEAAIRMGWDAIIGSDGLFVGMTGFGASAPIEALYAHFGITAEAIAEAAARRLKS